MKKVEQWDIKKNAVSSERGIVSAQNWIAAAAGSDVLAQGGNAIDAAISCAFALCAVEPWMCGLGGNGYIVIWLAQSKKPIVIDFQGVLPKSINHLDYPVDPMAPDSIMGFPGVKSNLNVVGYKSMLVPGAVAGLSLAQKKFGRLGFDNILSSAINLSEFGLPVNWHTTLQIALEASSLMKDKAAAAIFLPEGAPPQPEQNILLGKLAKTLRKLADNGPEDFYTGELAELLLADFIKGGSRISSEDLASYTADIVPPLSIKYRGTDIFTAGKTSGGARLNEALQFVQKNLDLTQDFGGHTYSIYAQALDKAFLSHNKKFGNSDNNSCTSHMSAVDAEGNMVALTYTLLNRFGSKVILPKTGILMNNSVAYFDPRPGYIRSMAGGKRIISSNMCPTICVKDGKAILAVGASGANQIIPCTMQIIAFLLDYNVSLEEAFNLPRIDANGGAAIFADVTIGEEAIQVLKKQFNVEQVESLVFPKLFACPSGVYRDLNAEINFGCGDKSNPLSGAISESFFPDNIFSKSKPVVARA